MTDPALVVRNATLRGRPGTWTIVLDADAIRAVERQQTTAPVLAHEAPTELDAEGNLVTIPFVDAHLHLCKVHTLDAAGDDPWPSTPRAPWAGPHRHRGRRDGQARRPDRRRRIRPRPADPARLGRERGPGRPGLRRCRPGRGPHRCRGGCSGRARSSGAGRRPGRRLPRTACSRPRHRGARHRAIRRGADVVGGIPWIEHTDADAKAHVDAMVTLAQRTTRRVAMLVDDAGDPGLRTTEMLAAALLERGWSAAGRPSTRERWRPTRADGPPARRAVKAAGLGFVTDPHTGPLHLRVTDLLAAGVPVALGQDDIEGRLLPVRAAQPPRGRLRRRARPRLPRRPAAGDLARHGHHAGLPRPRYAARRDRARRAADLLVLDGRTAREVLTRHSAARWSPVGGWSPRPGRSPSCTGRYAEGRPRPASASRVKVSSDADGLQAKRTGANGEVPSPGDLGWQHRAGPRTTEPSPPRPPARQPGGPPPVEVAVGHQSAEAGMQSWPPWVCPAMSSRAPSAAIASSTRW